MKVNPLSTTTEVHKLIGSEEANKGDVNIYKP